MSGWFLIVVSAKTLKLGPDFSTITNWWEPVPTEQSAFANILRVFLASTCRYTTWQIKFRQRLVIDRVIPSGLVNTKPQTGRRTCFNHIDQGSFKERRPPTVFLVFYAVSYSTQDIMFWLIFLFPTGKIQDNFEEKLNFLDEKWESESLSTTVEFEMGVVW